MTTEKVFARIISSLFHPLIIPTLAIVILFSINSYISFSIPKSGQRIILLIIVINTAIAPVLSILSLKHFKMINSILLEERADRIIPFFITGVFYLITFYIFRQASLPFIVYFFVLCAAILIFFALLITKHWKISAHMISIGGLTSFLISISILLKTELPIIIISSVLISGLLGYSRIKLKAHKPSEVYAGFGLGFCLILIITALANFG